MKIGEQVRHAESLVSPYGICHPLQDDCFIYFLHFTSQDDWLFIREARYFPYTSFLETLPGMWDLSSPIRLNPCPLLWKHRVLPTGPTEKSPLAPFLYHSLPVLNLQWLSMAPHPEASKSPGHWVSPTTTLCILGMKSTYCSAPIFPPTFYTSVQWKCQTLCFCASMSFLPLSPPHRIHAFTPSILSGELTHPLLMSWDAFSSPSINSYYLPFGPI